jgi:hypothetical protein
MKTCVCLRRLIVIDLYNDDHMLSVRYELRLWLIVMLGIDMVHCEVCTEAMVDHYAGDPQCHLCGIHSVICVVWTEAVVDHYAGDPHCHVCGMAWGMVDHYAGDRHCSLWGLYWGCGWSLCWRSTVSSVWYGLRLWLIIMLEIHSVICVVWTEAVVDLHTGDTLRSLWGMNWGWRKSWQSVPSMINCKSSINEIQLWLIVHLILKDGGIW